MSVFRVEYLTVEGERDSVCLTGPRGATLADARRVLAHACPSYGVVFLTCYVREVPKRPHKGFLHPIEIDLPGGHVAQLTNWFF